MIYLISNGADYSDHRLYFVKSYKSLEFVNEIVGNMFWSKGCVVGEAEDITWLKKYRGGTISLEELIKDNDYGFDIWDNEDNKWLNSKSKAALFVKNILESQ